MGVTGESSIPVAEHLKDDYYVILPTSTVYVRGQKYVSKENEVRQVVTFLSREEITSLELVTASSIGADFAPAFLSGSTIPVKHVFFDGGQFARIDSVTGRIMVPFLYAAVKSLYWSKGRTLKKILRCDDDSIKPCFIEAGRALSYRNLRRQLSLSLENKPFPKFRKIDEKNCCFEFGSLENHFKYRKSVMAQYPDAVYPLFMGYNHMQYKIRDPEGFRAMLIYIMKNDRMPDLPFLEWKETK